jgi:hypothetical protein
MAGAMGAGGGDRGRATLREELLMSAITLDLPDDLADRLRSLADRLPRIIALGIHEMDASPSQFAGTSEVLEFLATLPSPEETLALRPSPKLQARMTELLEKNRTSGLTADEREEIGHYEFAEHLVRMAKGRALVKLEKP